MRGNRITWAITATAAVTLVAVVGLQSCAGGAAGADVGAIARQRGLSSDDIVAAVRFAKRHGMSVAAQPVGHAATTAVDGTILLRTTGLRGLSVDVAGRTARVEAGVRSRDLNAALSGTGLTSLPGSSGDPSVVGYTLGGGMSWFGRKYGLAANRVRAIDLVDPDGRHVQVTEHSDPELFWALRGGGGDFGIVTAMEIELMPAPAIYGGRLAWSVEQTVPVLRAFSEVAAAAPDELTVWAWLLNLPAAPFVPEPLQNCWSVVVDLSYLGTAAEAEALSAYQQTRDDLARHLFEATDAVAAYDWDLDTLRNLLMQMSAEMTRESEALELLDQPLTASTAA